MLRDQSVYKGFNPKSRDSFFIPVIFLIISILALFIGFSEMQKRNELRKNGIRTDGVVTNVESYLVQERDKNGHEQTRTRYKSTLVFKAVDGKSYTSVIERQLIKNSKIPIVYSPQDPNKMLFESEVNSNSFIYGALVVSCVLCFLAIVFIYRVIIKRQSINDLMTNGQKIEAKIIGINQHTKDSHDHYGKIVVTKDRRSWQIIAQWTNPHNGESLSFSSYNTNSPLSGDVIGRSIDVFLDPQDSSQYYVDIDSIK